MKFKVNGEEVEASVEPETPLLWVLRDGLGLTGTKFGCGVGACGACTVHVGGQAIRSCQLPAVAAQSLDITTIEGLEHAAVQAWIDEGVPQCGYCQPGQIMAAAALLNRSSRPTDADIDKWMTNICRCGTYGRIRKAIHRAAATLPPPPEPEAAPAGGHHHHHGHDHAHDAEPDAPAAPEVPQ